MSQPYIPPTSVELGQLEQAVDWLDQIRQFIETHCLGAMPAITEALGSASNINMSDVDYKFTRQATVFGAFYSAYGIQARNDGSYKAVQDSLKELIAHLSQAADATRTIIQNYRTVEERNTAMAADIARALLGQVGYSRDAIPGVYPDVDRPYLA